MTLIYYLIKVQIVTLYQIVIFQNVTAVIYHTLLQLYISLDKKGLVDTKEEDGEKRVRA